MANLTRGWACLVALGCLFGLSQVAAAETPVRGARVVWTHGDRVYVASPDSLPLEPGMILTFRDRDKKVATGEVTAVHDRDLVAAKLTSGSLEKVKHLDRLAITADRPVIRAPSLLRVGYPAAGRKNLLFDCSYQSLDSSPRQGAYKAEAMGGQAYRLVRDSTYSVAAAWPDTLLVRLFDEVADEEIALERGDLDAAVFWPGEASAHIRKFAGWERRPGGPGGTRGRLAATVWRADEVGLSVALREDEWSALELLNHELFRDDLTPAPGWDKASALTAPGRFEVDPSLPGHEGMERFLNRAMGTEVPIDSARVVRLYYTNAFPKAQGPGGLPFEYWLMIRCPVISRTGFRPYLDAIDNEALAELFLCMPPKKP